MFRSKALLADLLQSLPESFMDLLGSDGLGSDLGTRAEERETRVMITKAAIVFILILKLIK